MVGTLWHATVISRFPFIYKVCSIFVFDSMLDFIVSLWFRVLHFMLLLYGDVLLFNALSCIQVRLAKDIALPCVQGKGNKSALKRTRMFLFFPDKSHIFTFLSQSS